MWYVHSACAHLLSLVSPQATKEEFKYSSELEGIVKVTSQSLGSLILNNLIQRWIEAVIKEPFPSPDFADSLNSGVILCKYVQCSSDHRLTLPQIDQYYQARQRGENSHREYRVSQ